MFCNSVFPDTMPISINRPGRTLYLLKQIESIARARLDAKLREHNLTSVQYTVLTLLDRPSALSSAQVARRSFVTPQAASEMIASLQKKGMIKRKEDSETRRILRLTLTAEGCRLLARCAADVSHIEEDILRNLTPRKAEVLRQTLSTIVDSAREDAAAS
jgi:DNA-binding MarR family transcriptional regulator